jgi:hypothetical protein
VTLLAIILNFPLVGYMLAGGLEDTRETSSKAHTSICPGSECYGYLARRIVWAD